MLVIIINVCERIAIQKKKRAPSLSRNQSRSRALGMCLLVCVCVCAGCDHHQAQRPVRLCVYVRVCRFECCCTLGRVLQCIIQINCRQFIPHTLLCYNISKLPRRGAASTLLAAMVASGLFKLNACKTICHLTVCSQRVSSTAIAVPLYCGFCG